VREERSFLFDDLAFLSLQKGGFKEILISLSLWHALFYWCLGKHSCAVKVSMGNFKADSMMPGQIYG